MSAAPIHFIGPRRGGIGRRRGNTLLYTVLIFMVLCGICSFAIDLGHMQLVKTELTRCADATVRGYMEYYAVNGQSYANANGPNLYATANNPVDKAWGVAPTISVQWGYWNTTTKGFSLTTTGGPVAVKVTASRTAANGNPVTLVWAALLGRATGDVTVSSVAALVPAQSTNVNVASTANPYLAGMPNGTTSIYGDISPANGAIQVTGIPVTPGTYLTFTNFTGTTSVDAPAGVPYGGAGGVTSIPVYHGQNFNYQINNPTSENGIADARMPESALMGLFLTNNAPSTTAAPATVDWTQASQQNQATYNNLTVQAPFMIGPGVTTSGVTQQFLVPPGATRFYIAIWDGVDYNNNSGSLSGTVSVAGTVQIMQ